MEEDGIEAQVCKFPRVGNGRNDSNKIGEEEDGELRRRGGGSDGSTNRFHSWSHHSSRIIRVSRASGGKDRHSKVMTSKGLRDRRVRLSVTTAIQFYDLQDRLGYDQPSKAVEWLIKAASDAISELPSLNGVFPETPKQPSDEKRGSVGGTEQEQGFDDSADAELDVDEGNYQQNQSQNLSRSKSACSSTSETSKGSGLSLSRPDMRVNRVKARERARERAAKEKEKEKVKENNDSSRIAHHHHHQNVNNPMSQTASFTELLTGGINASAPTSASSELNRNHRGEDDDEANIFNKASARQQWCSTPMMDYFNSGLLGPSSSRTHHQSSSGFPGQIQLGNLNSLPQAMPISPFTVQGDQNHSDQLQHYSFIPDHLMPTVVTSQSSGSDYNLNFTISSGLAGFNSRGTLQSNSPSLLPQHPQRFPLFDGSNLPFFMGAAAAAASSAPAMENHHHHQFSPGFDGRLQLCYGDGSRHSDQKGKGKN